VSEHKVAGEKHHGWGRYGLYSLTLTCTCGERFGARGKNKHYAMKNAEAKFREHIPIRLSGLI